MDTSAQRKTRVLFFAWGESIHARRRVGLFTEDPAFEVGVISTFAYEFANARNFYLSQTDSSLNRSVRYKKLLGQPHVAVFASLLYLISKILGAGISAAECYYLVADALLVRRYVREFNPDVIFLQTLMYPCYLSFFISSAVPIIITFWNGDVTWWAKWSGIERRFKRRIVIYGVRRAKAITVNSKAAFQACIDFGADQNKVSLMPYPGVNLEMFRPAASKQDARRQLGIGHAKVVLCPRGLGEYLNSDVIIEAAAMVINVHSDTIFLFLSGVGSDELWRKHLERAEQLGIAANVRRDGQVPWEKMPLYYHAADVMVSVSSNDSLPNCMLEAMACGVPVLMGDIPQIRDWVTNEANGLLVPPHDFMPLSQALLRLLEENNPLTEAFVRINLDLVGRQCDAKKNSLLVKHLVHDIAGR